MAKVKGRKHLNQKEFDLIKTLLDGGIAERKIADVTSRSVSTVHRISQAGNLNEYHKTNADYNRKYRPVKAARGESSVSEQVDVVATLQGINDSLLAINERMTWLADNCAVPNKRRFW